MEYHSDRFSDYSLLVFKSKKLVAVLPANRIGNVVCSHQGLSYGGLLLNSKTTTETYYGILKEVLVFLKNNNVIDLIIKELPFIYHKQLSGEFDYFIHKLEYEIIETNSYFVLDNTVNYQPNRNRKRALKKVELSAELVIVNKGLSSFWQNILIPNLYDKFQISPVHTYSEIELLNSIFKENIVFYGVELNNELQAGVLLFITDTTVHFQYSSGNDERNNTNALDFLFDFIIRKYKTAKYISFGSSATDKRLLIDSGLAYWKESFGAHLIPQQTFLIKTSSKLTIDDIIK